MVALSALTTHLLFGGACMMPMAMAQDDMPAMQHGMQSMSSHGSQDDSKDGGGNPCDQGHCFEHALPFEESFNNGSQDIIAPAAVLDVDGADIRNGAPIPKSAAPPGHFFHVETIVLRN